jgi:hypothetical protein
MANKKRTNNDLQNIAQKTIEQQEHTKNWGEVGFSGRVVPTPHLAFVVLF